MQINTINDLHVLAQPPSRTVAPPTEPPASAKPGDEWVNDRGMVFCWCPPGTFTLGSAVSAQTREEDETPAEVEFAQGFWMAKFEFTRREMAGMALGVYLSTGDHKLHPLNKIHFGTNFQTTQVDQYLEVLNPNSAVRGVLLKLTNTQSLTYEESLRTKNSGVAHV